MVMVVPLVKIFEFYIKMGEFSMLNLKWIPNKDLLYSTGNSAAWMGGEFGEWIRVYVWLSPFAVTLKLSLLC